MYNGGPLFILAFAALLNVTHVDGLEDDFSNMLIEITDSSGTYFADHSLLEYEPGSWASVNVTVPEEEYSLSVLASNGTEADAEETYPGMVEVAYAEGMARDFSNLVVVFASPQGEESPVGHTIVTTVPGEWAILSLERPPAEGESISIFISQPVEQPEDDGEAGGGVPDAIPESGEPETPPDEPPQMQEDETFGTPGAEEDAASQNDTEISAGPPEESPSALPLPATESGLHSLGGEDYVELPGFDIYPGEGDFTAVAWIRTGSVSDGVVISSGECCEIEKYWSMTLSAWGEGASLLVRLNDGSGEISSIGKANLADGGWHHVAFVRDRASGTVAGYVDGAPDLLFDDTSRNITDSSVELFVGNSNPHQHEWFEGTVAGAATYLRALSAEEVALLASSPAPLEGDAG